MTECKRTTHGAHEVALRIEFALLFRSVSRVISNGDAIAIDGMNFSGMARTTPVFTLTEDDATLTIVTFGNLLRNE